jgi:ankyrin repeat protein
MKQTPLHIAVSEGHERIARLLVENGSPIDVKNKDGKTPLDLCSSARFADILQSNFIFSQPRQQLPLILNSSYSMFPIDYLIESLSLQKPQKHGKLFDRKADPLTILSKTVSNK